MLLMSDDWKRVWPKAHVGAMLLSRAAAPKGMSTKTKEDMLQELRRRLSRIPAEELAVREPVKAYSAYCQHFNLPFDIRIALDAMLAAEKNRANLNPITEAVFYSSMDYLLPTSCHDRDLINKPLLLHIAAAGQKISLNGGKQQEALVKDMLVSDSRGVVASAIFGGDHRTRVRHDTQRTLILTMAPPGLTPKLIYEHFFSIHAAIRHFAPQVEINYFQII